jgi:mycoredoxin
MPEKLVVYGHPTCPNVGPIKWLLRLTKVPFDYIDIHQDQTAAATVRSLNHGNESVPTLVFPDGSILTEPSLGELKPKLESLGFKVGPIAWLIGNFWFVVLAIGVLIAILRSLGFF